MSKKKVRPNGCLRCGRILKSPSASGMGPTCEKKGLPASYGLGGRPTPKAEGQVPMFQEGAKE